MSDQAEFYPSIPEIARLRGDSFPVLEQVATHRLIRVAALFVLSGFVIISAAAAFLPWVQTVSGTGRVIAYSPDDRPQDIESPIDGRIQEWRVREGERVRKGDPVVDLIDIDPDILSRLATERDAAQTKLDAAQARLATAKINLDRQKSLWTKGLSARRAFELAELELAKFLSEVSTASAELARIETRLARQAAQLVVAPRDGVIQRILAPQGGIIVKQGNKLATIVPESADRAVELFVSGNDVPLLSSGRPVRLQFEGWPAVQFSGWPAVAVGTFPGEVRVIDPSDDGNGNFRILVFP